jgi:hypothetical protein
MAPEAKGHAVGQPINIVRQEETLALHVAAKGCAITREPQEGDASFWGYLDGEPAHIGVERKHADDLIKSYKSGHLADQLRRMLDTYSLVILLVEGSLWPIGADRHAHSITTMSAGQSCSFDALMNDLQTWQDVGVRMQWTEHNDAVSLPLLPEEGTLRHRPATAQEEQGHAAAVHTRVRAEAGRATTTATH